MVMEAKPVGVLASSAVNAETTDGSIAPCLMARAGTGGNQLPLVAVEETKTYGMETFHCTSEEEKSPTLKARDWKDPSVVVYEEPIAIDRAFFNQGQNAQYDPQYYTDGTGATSAVAVRYIVRRLTPTECARLQGFPDEWGHPGIKETLSDEEYAFWLNVRNTHAEINGKATKEYTRDQMLTWYNKLHTDSAEYKLWGNGIALPCALYVMEGIADEC